MPQHHTMIAHDASVLVTAEALPQRDGHVLAPYGALPQSWRQLGWIAFMNEAERGLAMALVSYVNGSGQCWPSMTRLACDAGLSHGAVYATMSRLEAFQLVERFTRRGHKTIFQLKQATRQAPQRKDRKPLGPAGRQMEPAGLPTPPPGVDGTLSTLGGQAPVHRSRSDYPPTVDSNRSVLNRPEQMSVNVRWEDQTERETRLTAVREARGHLHSLTPRERGDLRDRLIELYANNESAVLRLLEGRTEDVVLALSKHLELIKVAR